MGPVCVCVVSSNPCVSCDSSLYTSYHPFTGGDVLNANFQIEGRMLYIRDFLHRKQRNYKFIGTLYTIYAYIHILYTYLQTQAHVDIISHPLFLLYVPLMLYNLSTYLYITFIVITTLCNTMTVQTCFNQIII